MPSVRRGARGGRLPLFLGRGVSGRVMWDVLEG